MTIKGFLEYVDSGRVGGWAYDTAQPSYRLMVSIGIGDKIYASGRADIFRNDLLSAGIDDGSHGFNIDITAAALPAGALKRLQVRAVSGEEWLLLRRAQQKGKKREIELAASEAVPVSDTTQFPVFILGPARSGTSAVALALLQSGRYHGRGEGHLWSLAQTLLSAVDAHYQQFAEATSRETTLSRVSSEAITGYLRRGFVQLARRLHSTAYWIDKTPTLSAVLAAPLLMQLWPQARFIFVRRRLIENLLSRRRKFPQQSDEEQYSDWAAIMRAWLEVREQLKDAALEIEHRQLVTDPVGTSRAIATFLEMPGAAAEKFQDYLLHSRPDQTDVNFGAVHDLAALDMTDEETQKLREECDEMMVAYGYAYDTSYSRD